MMNLKRSLALAIALAVAIVIQFGMHEIAAAQPAARGDGADKQEGSGGRSDGQRGQRAQRGGQRSGQPAGAGRPPVDKRTQYRTYHFEDTDEDLPYCLFVSSKVSEQAASPLIVMLHGITDGPDYLMRPKWADLAEEGGYILVSPMGYNTTGWYGIPAGGGGGRGGRGARGGRGTGGRGFGGRRDAGRGAAPQSPTEQPAGQQAGAQADQRNVAVQNEEARPENADAAEDQPLGRSYIGYSPRGQRGGTAVTDNARVRELSEKDVMNVLAMVRGEFNVDGKRIYVVGHSMGGAGALYLGVKHADIWAGVGAMAPAAFGIDPSMLENAKKTPMIIVHGDRDGIPLSLTQSWADKMKELEMTYEYDVLPGVDHGGVITAGAEAIVKFFTAHSKADSSDADAAAEGKSSEPAEWPAP